jgi:glycosyltransferase 2 family protein
MKQTKAVISIAKFGVTALLFYVIFKNIDLSAFLCTFTNLDLLFIALVCLLYPLGLYLSAVKLRLLLFGYHLPIPLKTSFDLNWISGFFNNFFPAQ